MANASTWNPLTRYTRWLHTKWPAGTVERLPAVNADGSTNVPGVYIVGDLTGIPLLKFSSDTGSRVVQTIVADGEFKDAKPAAGVLDLIIVGGGVSGFAAALEARKANLQFQIIEAAEPFFTIVNFPKGKPIYTYPTEMKPAGDLQFHAKVKEPLVAELRAQTLEKGIKPRIARAQRVQRKGDLLEVVLARDEKAGSADGDGEVLQARRVVLAIGRAGDYRRLNVPGEDLDKVYNRLHDPADFANKDVLVVGGGDSALETAIAVAEASGRVTLSYRKAEFNRPKSQNVDRLEALGDRVKRLMSSEVKEIRQPDVVVREENGNEQTLPNDAVLTMIGREPPLDFVRRSGIKVRGDWTIWSVATLVLFLTFCFWMYHWKSYKPFFGAQSLPLPAWMSPNPEPLVRSVAERGGRYFTDEKTLGGTVLISARGRSFYYTVAYSSIVVGFGIARIRRRRTPYVTWQTITLMVVQVIPLFILPEIVLPWLGRNGFFDVGMRHWIAETFFPGASWWRAYGLVLAWPLFVYNWFTDTPIWGWLILGGIQTFVIIPAIVYYWGKGAYCGWICSCGALAETLGDQHRQKMPHGPWWNRLNMLGQLFLALALALMVLRGLGWAGVGWADHWFHRAFDRTPVISYGWFVDLLWSGVLGVGLYFWFSGRVWCRFACPLAALMHIYARFSRFRILADKKRCISCNVCTSVCHQGIDVMSFANKGLPMADPQCVRCSACVQMCPTGVLSFGQVECGTDRVIKTDPKWLAASPVLMREMTVNGKPLASADHA